MSKPIVEGLNPQQREAVLHEGGPLLILAGAGSGKTRVISHKFAHIAKKHSPNSIFAVTFTNKAASEMKERIGAFSGADLKKSWIGTFHSLCNRMLRKEIPAMGYKSDFSIYDEQDQCALIRHILKEFKIYEALYKGIISKISGLKSSLVTPEEFLTNGEGFGFEEKLARVYLRYQDELKRCNALDFDDLIMLTVKMFQARPDLLEKYQNKFKYVLVDEFQDTNPSQYKLLRLLSASHNELSVVGDDDQSIYGFRGATVENILSFKKDYPKAKIIKLEQNYRSTQNILHLAGNIIKENPERWEKTLWSERGLGEKTAYCWFGSEEDESKYISKIIKELYLKGLYDYGDFSILYRINLQSRALENALRHEKIPYHIVGGISFYQRKEIKDLASYMRLVTNIDDNVSLRRIINTPSRGIGASTLSKIEQTSKKKNVSLFMAVKSILKAGGLNSTVKEKLDSFVKIIEDIAGSSHKSAADMLRNIYIKTGYSDNLEEDRAENVRLFIDSAENKDIPEFLDTLSLVSNSDDETEGSAVSLHTLHGTKGLEYPVVFLSGIEEGVLPYFKAETPKELAEERRLLYVGMTRAKDMLWLTGAKRRRLYSKIQEHEPSRFLSNIPEEVLCKVNKVGSEAQCVAMARKKIKTFKQQLAYAVGCRVKHPKWGVGVVRDCYGIGDDQKITVNFPAIGIKRLALKFANLEKIN